MSRWFRHYAGMMRDDKLVRVAIRSKQTVERVAWVWGAILESAAEIDDEGHFDFDVAEAAYFLRAGEDELLAIVRELENAGRLAGSIVVKWSDRQFKSDRSAERQSRYRQRQKEGVGDGGQGKPEGNADGGVTSLSRHGDAPETETETETEDKDEAAPHSRAAPLPVAEAVEIYNQAAEVTGWPTVQRLSDARRTACKARLRAEGLEGWRSAISRAQQSPYLGRDPPSWFTFDWIVKAANFTKLIEGNYDRNRTGNPNGNAPSAWGAARDFIRVQHN